MWGGLQGQSLALITAHERKGGFVWCNTSRFLFSDFTCMPITYATHAHRRAAGVDRDVPQTWALLWDVYGKDVETVCD